MKVKIYISLNSEMRFMRIHTQFKNPITDYTKSNILTKRLMLLSVVWDKKDLLFTKRLHMMNENIGYSYAKPLWKVFRFVVHFKHIYMYIFLRSWSHACECKKKVEQNCLDGSAFAIVFLRARHAVATVLHMQQWTHHIPLNMDLWFMNLGPKNVC